MPPSQLIEKKQNKICRLIRTLKKYFYWVNNTSEKYQIELFKKNIAQTTLLKFNFKKEVVSHYSYIKGTVKW